jgi:FtsZ-interacting cell division protein ZipA
MILLILGFIALCMVIVFAAGFWAGKHTERARARKRIQQASEDDSVLRTPH